MSTNEFQSPDLKVVTFVMHSTDESDQPVRQSRSAKSIDTSPVNSTTDE